MAAKIQIKDLASKDFVTIEGSESMEEIRKKLAQRKKYVVLQVGQQVRVQTRDLVLKALENIRRISVSALSNMSIPAIIVSAQDKVVVRPGSAFAVRKGNKWGGVYLAENKLGIDFTIQHQNKGISIGDRDAKPKNKGGTSLPKLGSGIDRRAGIGGRQAKDLGLGYGGRGNDMIGYTGAMPEQSKVLKSGEGKAGKIAGTAASRGTAAKKAAPKNSGEKNSSSKKGGVSGGRGKGQSPKGPVGNPKGDRAEKKPYYLNAIYPEQVTIKEKVKIEVNVSQKAGAKASLAAVVEERVPITVVLSFTSGFPLQQNLIGEITPGGTEEESKCSFELTATTVGKGEVSVFAFQKSQSLGSIEFSIEIVQAAKRAKQGKSSARIESSRSTSPDLSFFITEQKNSSTETSIYFTIDAADANLKIRYKQYGPINLNRDPASYFIELFSSIEGFNKGIFTNGKVTIDQMERIGSMLYEKLIPGDLKTLLWEIKDKIKTIVINSTEPFIPWEICRISGKEAGRTVEYGFLAEKYQLTRWIPNTGFPEPVLDIRNWAVVVPEDTNLNFTSTELKFLKTLAGSRYSFKAIDATYTEVKNNLQSGQYSLWHFSGHGSSQESDDPNKAVIFLNKGEKFMPDYISGKVRDLGAAKPLIFFNACQIGKGGMGLTGIGGWASQLLGAGASAFIGAYWSILDDSALDFAKEFYNSLIKRKLTIGEAVLRARNKIKPKGDPAWLAYVVYADPYARIAG